MGFLLHLMHYSVILTDVAATTFLLALRGNTSVIGNIIRRANQLPLDTGFPIVVVQCVPSCYIVDLQKGGFSWKVHPGALYSKSRCLCLRLSLQADLLTGIELDRFKMLVVLSLQILSFQLSHFIFLFVCFWFFSEPQKLVLCLLDF